MISLLKITSIFCLCFMLTACPAKFKSASHSVSKTVVMGDPKKLIEGAEMNPTIPEGFFNSNEAVHLYSFVEFVQKKTFVKSKNTKQDATEENAPTSDEDADSLPPSYKLSVISTAQSLSLSQNTHDDIFNLKINKYDYSTELDDGGVIHKGRLLHTSLSADQNVISLLFFQNDLNSNEGQSIFVIYLAKHFQPKFAEQVSKNYFYLLGPGKRAGWPAFNRQFNTVYIDLCGPKPLSNSQLIGNQVKKWRDALENRIDFNYRNVKAFKPFSDLNQQCLYIVDDYLTEADNTYANYGLTVSVFDHNKPQMIDGDIILFTKEFEKNGLPYDSIYLQKNLLVTLLHEMGHFLGLDHQFTGVKSIMSYDFDTIELTDYDREAIQTLYKILTP